MTAATVERTAPLAALSRVPGPEEIAGAFWTCCDVELEMAAIDRGQVAYLSDWSGATWPGQQCPRCGQPMAIGSRPRAVAPSKAEEMPTHLTRAEVVARHRAAKRANELLVQSRESDDAHTLEEAKRRLLPFGDPEYVGKPLSECPRPLLYRVHRWANAKKRRDRFASLARDIDLVLTAPGCDDFEAEPAGLDDDDQLEFAS